MCNDNEKFCFIYEFNILFIFLQTFRLQWVFEEIPNAADKSVFVGYPVIIR